MGGGTVKLWPPRPGYHRTLSLEKYLEATPLSTTTRLAVVFALAMALVNVLLGVWIIRAINGH